MKSIDLSKSVVFGQRSGKEELDGTVGSCIMACDCPSLESIILPEKDELRINYLDIECLPKLKDFDMAKFVAVNCLMIGDLPQSYNLVYPNLKEFDYTDFGATMFSISENSYNFYKKATTDFITKYYVKDGLLEPQGYLSSMNNDSYDWDYDF